MKRLSVLTFLGAVSFGLFGCPVFDDSSQGQCDFGHDHHDGTFDNCSVGGGDVGGGKTGGCTAPDQCGVNETCGSDGQCHSGDCSIWKCVAGYSCETEGNGFPVCVQGGTGGSLGSGGSGGSGGVGAAVGSGGSGAAGGAGGASTGGGGAGSGGAPAIWCGNPGDCAAGQTCAPDGTCKAGDCTADDCIFGYTCNSTSGVCDPNNPAACGSDGDCAADGTGYECIDGLCTAPGNQCFDGSQCAGAVGEKCAAGKCEPGCTQNSDCPASYTCDTTTGVCSTPVKACTITNDCGSATNVCVDGACVPRSSGGTCPSGSTWVENGCIPTQAATFTCNVDGEQDACVAGSICLHHSCYISCDPPNQNACTTNTSFPDCKTVASSSGDHSVCGSDQTLGNQCDGTAGLDCTPPAICVDGYCK